MENVPIGWRILMLYMDSKYVYVYTEVPLALTRYTEFTGDY